VSLKKANENIDVTASDISAGALTIAMLNAKINNVDIDFIKSDLFEKINEKYDVIISNPPYIKTEEINGLQSEVKYEPYSALDGGEDGLKFYKEIINKSKKHLSQEGVLALEIGYNQAEEVTKILQENNFKNIRVIKDYGNNDRVVIANAINE
jgi:release factor glutamine methyltransferase